MRIPHPIPYQGSKRNLASQILRFFPENIDRLIEPFAGSAALSIASAFYFKSEKFIINDINSPLVKLLDQIINDTENIVKHYHDIWHAQLGQEEEYYYKIRDKFNSTQKPDYLLFLLAKCVKAAVRYNLNGEFNQSPDKRRKGKKPENMRNDIIGVSNLLKNKTTLYSTDYNDILELATTNDLIYLDPPYQGTGKNGGFSYLKGVNYEDFIISLYKLNKKNIPYILSYDGRTGNKTYGKELPNKLNLTKIEIDAGRSSIATLLNRTDKTYEALYISEAVINKINFTELIQNKMELQQLLF